MTPYEQHRQRWQDCERCSLSTGRRCVVLARGTLPAPVLFIGEAPGESENLTGKPFCPGAPAGRLLDAIVERGTGGRCKCCFTNLVGCIPRGANGSKLDVPPTAAIEACMLRLQAISQICQPSIIVRVGRLATDWTQGCLCCSLGEYHWADIIHPAAILRMNVAQQGLAIQRSVVTLADAVDELLDKEH